MNYMFNMDTLVILMFSMLITILFWIYIINPIRELKIKKLKKELELTNNAFRVLMNHTGVMAARNIELEQENEMLAQALNVEHNQYGIKAEDIPFRHSNNKDIPATC